MAAIQEKPVPLSVRIELCRAGLQVMADGLGIRVLHIKGSTVDPSIRPVAAHGSDVDVIVDPRRTADMHRTLLAHGWEVYSTFDEGSPFGHAQTYWHQDWGYIDLHRRFPGIGRDDGTAFEVLWRDRGTVTAAGRPVPVPGRAAQGVLLVLNAARGEAGDRAEALAFQDALPPERRREHQALLAELDAEVAAAVVTGDLERWRRDRRYLLWRSIVEGGSRSQEWWGRVRAARTPGEAMRVILRAPRVNRSRLAHQLGRRPTPRDVLAAVVSRAGRAVRELRPRRRWR